jgi:N-methylhydantoinase B
MARSGSSGRRPRPWGLNGGGEGKGPEVSLSFPDGKVEDPLKMRARQLPTGTVVETKTGGGGGNGDPMQRSFAEVCGMSRAGLVSRDMALSAYGVAIAEDGSVDQAASVAR